jgi:uncharacterized protein with PIN domain
MVPKKAFFRFYAELNDFLARENKFKTFAYPFQGRPTVKDAIEACGVPHPEVEIILLNGKSVDFGYILRDGDSVSVYPVFESLDISPLLKLREKPLRKSKFIVDVNLGKLVRNLRMLGFDVYYRQQLPDKEIIRISLAEKRIILTRDQDLLKNAVVRHGYWVRSTDPHKQTKEIFRRFNLKSQVKAFSRCMKCNGLIKPVQKEKISDRIPEKTAAYMTAFWQCADCGQVYWQGSHYDKMQKQIELLMTEENENMS